MEEKEGKGLDWGLGVNWFGCEGVSLGLVMVAFGVGTGTRILEKLENLSITLPPVTLTL